MGKATRGAWVVNGAPTTALPVGVVPGDVLVSFLESQASASIRCGPGWDRALDFASRGRARLVACATTVQRHQTRPSAVVGPPSQVSMVTMAFSGVDSVLPYGASARLGVIAPLVTDSPGAVLVMAVGTDSSGVRAEAPTGARGGTIVNDGRDSQLGMAVQAAVSSRSTTARTWRNTPRFGASVVGTVALEPPRPPSAPPVSTCNNSSVLAGPAVVPKGAVTVPAGDNTSLAASGGLDGPGKTYFFATGTHTIESQVIPGNNSTYIGAPGAIIDGDGTESPMFSQTARAVTIEYLTIENYWQPEGQNVVNSDAGVGWTIEHDTIGPNNPNGHASYDGYGLGVGDNDTVEYDCIIENSEGGFNASGRQGALLRGVVISNNTIYANGLGDYPDNCGCAAGGKIFWSWDATITDNYVYGNYGAGIWADFNNVGLEVSGNYIARNWGNGLTLECDSNADIANNAFVGNGWASAGSWPSPRKNGEGPQNGAGGFPYGAIYLNQSGGDPNLESNYSGELLVENNLFRNNFGGVIVYDNPDRFCGSPWQADCTLDNSTLYYPNPATQATDAVENGTTTVTSAAGFKVPYTTGSSSPAAKTPTVGATVSGPHVPAGDTVASVASDYAITLSLAATGSGTGLTIDIYTPGGCGPYDLIGSSRSKVSGSPPEDYHDNCYWSSQNVTVEYNRFNMNASAVTGCTTRSLCGYMGIFSLYGAGISWPSPYSGYATETEISKFARNVWKDNTYSGTWYFDIPSQGRTTSYATWMRAPYNQDAGSLFTPVSASGAAAGTAGTVGTSLSS